MADLEPVTIRIPAGVLKTEAEFAATGRWIDMDKVRFVRGLPEKLGGVQLLVQSLGAFTGIARGAVAWNTYTNYQSGLFGTEYFLYSLLQGDLTEITPYRVSGRSLSTDPFDMTDGSAIVTVNDTAHGITTAGICVNFSGASAAGGITIDGDYYVTEIVDANSYTITHSSAATSTASGGGASVTAAYCLNAESADPSYLLGFGLGGFGEGYWGTDVSISEALLSEPSSWSFSVYGEDAICCRLGGTLYVYDSSAGVGRVAAITNAPAQVRSVVVTPERYIMALGCTKVGGGFDAMTVRWPDVDDYTDWTPATTNTSNERKLQGGTRLMAAVALTGGTTLVWSDTSIFTFLFTGSKSIYRSKREASACGLIGPHAHASSGTSAFWMSQGNFWMFAGAVQPIPNVEDIRDWVFRRLNTTYQFKCFAHYVERHNEVWFYYPSTGNTEPDSYVAVKLDDYSWIHGTFARSASMQFSAGERRPIFFGTDKYIWAHDSIGSPNDDGEAMRAYIEMAPFEIAKGKYSMDIFGFVPNWQRHTGDVELYLYGLDWPEDTDFNTDTVTISEGDKIVDTRASGRQCGFKLTSDAVDGDFRLGTPKLLVQRAGART